METLKKVWSVFLFVLLHLSLSVVVGAFLITTPILLLTAITFSPMLGFLSTAGGFGLLRIYNHFRKR